MEQFKATTNYDEAVKLAGLDIEFLKRPLYYRDHDGDQQTIARWVVFSDIGHLFGDTPLRAKPPLPVDVFRPTSDITAAGFRYVGGCVFEDQVLLVQRHGTQRVLLHRYWPTDGLATTNVFWAVGGIPTQSANLKSLCQPSNIGRIWRWYQRIEVEAKIAETKGMKPNFIPYVESQLDVTFPDPESMVKAHDIVKCAAPLIVEKYGPWWTTETRRIFSSLWALVTAYT